MPHIEKLSDIPPEAIQSMAEYWNEGKLTLARAIYVWCFHNDYSLDPDMSDDEFLAIREAVMMKGVRL